MKGKKPMPGYYSKNIVRHAERKFFRRKAMEAVQEKSKACPPDAVGNGKDRKSV